MLYVEEKSFDRQLNLLARVTKNRGYDLVLWLYPESSLNEIFGVQLGIDSSEDLEPVTTYEDGVVAKRSPRLRCEEAIFKDLAQNKKLVSKNFDSVCVYETGKKSWLFCAIGHEGMGLVRDESLFDYINNEGFAVSKTPPSWW